MIQIKNIKITFQKKVGMRTCHKGGESCAGVARGYDLDLATARRAPCGALRPRRVRRHIARRHRRPSCPSGIEGKCTPRHLYVSLMERLTSSAPWASSAAACDAALSPRTMYSRHSSSNPQHSTFLAQRQSDNRPRRLPRDRLPYADAVAHQTCIALKVLPPHATVRP